MKLILDLQQSKWYHTKTGHVCVFMIWLVQIMYLVNTWNEQDGATYSWSRMIWQLDGAYALWTLLWKHTVSIAKICTAQICIDILSGVYRKA